MSWTAILIHPGSPELISNTILMFLLLLVIAVSSMLAANLPIAAVGATAPVTGAIALNYILSGTFDSLALAGFALAAEIYFTLLAHRLHSTTLGRWKLAPKRMP